MPVSKASAVWEENLAKGKGKMTLASGPFDGSYTFATRFEGGKGTNPEELIGAAHAGCYSMALSHGLFMAGHTAKRIQTDAEVHLDKVGDGFKITKIKLTVEADVAGVKESTFAKLAEDTKENCPVSQALNVPEVLLDAKLVS